MLLPGALGAVASALLFRSVLEGLAVAGSGGLSAVSAGAAEALVPSLFGLGAVGALGLLGLLLTLAGSGRAAEDATGRGLSRPVLALAGVAGFGIVMAFVFLMLGSVERPPTGPEAYVRDWRVALAAGSAFALVLLGLIVGGLVRAPRTRAPASVKAGAVAALSLCVLGSAAGGWLGYVRLRCLMSAAVTGVPCGGQPVTAADSGAAAMDPGDEPESGAEPPLIAETPPSAQSDVQTEPPPPPPTSRPRVTPRPVRAASTPGRAAPAPGPEDAAEPPETTPTARPERRSPQPLRVGGAVREPRKLRSVNPVYPREAYQARVQGVVILECTVGTDGKVTDVRVLRGIPLLTEAAMDAVRQWVYEPTVLNGIPVPVIMTVTVNFKLS